MVCFMMRGTTKCNESLYNLVAMVTYLPDNPRNVQCNGRTRRNFGVDFLYLFFDFFLESFDLPNIINDRC